MRDGMDNDQIRELLDKLSADEKKEFERLNEEINETKLKLGKALKDKLRYARDCARARGITAKHLRNLKSKSGKSFEEIRNSHYYFSANYTITARAGDKFDSDQERAYLCGFDGNNSCGWVKGVPSCRDGENHCIVCGRVLD